MGFLNDIMADDDTWFFDVDIFGEMVDYGNLAGVVASIPGNVSQELQDIQDLQSGRVKHRVRRIRLKLVDAPSPTHGETIKCRGETWVIDICEVGQTDTVCTCVLPVTIEVAGQGYRNR